MSFSYRWRLVAVVVFVAILARWPSLGSAQSGTGQARAVQATLGGLFGTTTTTMADTGTLSGPSDARDASQITGGIPGVLVGQAFHAATIGWIDQVASEASVASLALNVGGTAIGADFIMARATSAVGSAGVGTVNIDGFSVNGVSIPITGQPNQTVSIPGGSIIINEQQISAARTVVNALHVQVIGVADIIVASATAGR
jgi:hypothetical protein